MGRVPAIQVREKRGAAPNGFLCPQPDSGLVRICTITEIYRRKHAGTPSAAGLRTAATSLVSSGSI
jgi:hypothetical protein